MIQSIIRELPEKVRPYLELGKVADYIPALSVIAPDKFGIAVTTVDGKTCYSGDSREKFSVQSIVKVFSLVFAIRCVGDRIWEHVGRKLTTKAFNAITPIEEAEGIPRNPFTNGGAMVIVDMLLSHDRNFTQNLLTFIHKLTGNSFIAYDFSVAESEKLTGHRNAAIAQFLKSYHILKNDVDDVLTAYFCLCSLSMSCEDLSRALLFLANRGLDPLTESQIISSQQCRRVNAILMMFGTYEASGDFVFRIGLPGKSGVGGGISVIVPRKYSITVWSPPLDEFGTSVAGLKALEFLTEQTDLSIL